MMINLAIVFCVVVNRKLW